MKIYLGSDHAGFELKEKITVWLSEWGYSFEDLGAKTMRPKDDYPDFIAPVAHKVGENPDENRGIILGGSGQGEVIVANRFPSVRAVFYYGGPLAILKLAREHNNANVLVLGSKFVKPTDLPEILKTWLNTEFEGGRHRRRVNQIKKMEQGLNV